MSFENSLSCAPAIKYTISATAMEQKEEKRRPCTLGEFRFYLQIKVLLSLYRFIKNKI
jgi:hypothetical protein